MRARPVLAALALTLAFAAPLRSAAAGGADRADALRGETGDAVRGAQLYEARCGGCHSADASRVGPAHRGVFGRRAGTAAGFDYSPALRASRLVWDARTLDAWLADPERTIPGQAMGYRVDDARDRADLIAHLRELR
ncbi:MAG: c-type cytochrome [Pseudomonadota bacterium]